MRTLILFLCSFSAAFGAALNVTMQWDVRTTGSDSNSGGFDPGVSVPGTDYSQQNSPQITYTDLVIGSTTTTYTSVLNVVSSALPGNTLKITGGSGCTTGTYEILSNSTITATVNSSLGTAASVCTAVLGGSFATICSAHSGGNCTAGAFAVTADSNTVWEQSGTYTCTALANSACYDNQNAVGTPVTVTVEGYGATHGDFGTRPLMTTSAASTSIFYLNSKMTLINLSMSNTTGGAASSLVNNSAGSETLILYRCKLDISGTTGGQGIYIQNANPSTGVWDSEFVLNSTGYGIEDTGGNNSPVFIGQGSYFHGGMAGIWDGNNGNNQRWYISDSTFASNTRHVYMQNGGPVMVLHHNNFYNATNEAVRDNQGNGYTYLVDNNIFWGGTYGFYAASFGSSVGMTNANAYGNLSVANYTGIPAGYNSSDIALTASPFKNPSTPDFSLNSTAGGGALLKAAGFPGVTAAGTGYLDIGALQSQGSSGSTGGGPHAFVQ